MIYHIVIGDMAAAPLEAAMALKPEIAGEVVVIKDLMNLGPISKSEEGQKFSELRSLFWQEVIGNDKTQVSVDDTERILKVSATLAGNEDAVVWVWVAPWPADICTQLWVSKYFGKYPGRYFVINIAGLPFLDEDGKIFYPKNISELLPKEIVKARKLARAVTYAEIETDTDDWNRLTKENATIRTLEGVKRIVSRSADYYDTQLISFCSQQFQKASKVVSQTMAKYTLPTGDTFLGWRLRSMATHDILRVQGDTAKTLKDFEIKIPSGLLDFDGEATAANETTTE